MSITIRLALQTTIGLMVGLMVRLMTGLMARVVAVMHKRCNRRSIRNRTGKRSLGATSSL